MPRFPDGMRTLTVPGPPPLMMSLNVDGNTATSVQGTWTYIPATDSYACPAINSSVQCQPGGTFTGASGGTAYGGTWN